MNDKPLLYINHRVQIDARALKIDGVVQQNFEQLNVSEIAPSLYRSLGIAYPKFFKMDGVSRLGFMATEYLMQLLDKDFDRERVAVLLTTADACLEVDERFEESRSSIPSPALFVYTLPNIVAGEICIRHGFKGEQMVWVAPEMDMSLNGMYMESMFTKGNTEAILCGFVNAYKDHFSCDLMWVSQNDFGGNEIFIG